ncbi:hypothetical protein FNV43_RR06060 [Rhamnella rubrinervis]|uniref:Uncharacterized protein n=1 Tax=Rhamnella rubrinervis TaxID=2594499 RepID=A0A8K0HCR7_9ROSA|nr:hypothetical protein FNV43_RR06060 [Rhamnella rubrinervis]
MTATMVKILNSDCDVFRQRFGTGSIGIRSPTCSEPFDVNFDGITVDWNSKDWRGSGDGKIQTGDFGGRFLRAMSRSTRVLTRDQKVVWSDLRWNVMGKFGKMTSRVCRGHRPEFEKMIGSLNGSIFALSGEMGTEFEFEMNFAGRLQSGASIQNTD